jgi:adenylate cyclase
MSESAARLLVIDDNKINRMLLSRHLEQQGHRVETAVNGQEGLETHPLGRV